MDPPIAEVVEVSKTYPGEDAPAVRGVSLELRAGEFFSLLGPSGCGKSTTLRIVAGLESQTAGIVRIRGEDMGRRPANRRPTNMVFQNLGLFSHLDVAHNVAFGLKVRRVAKTERNAAVANALQLVELGQYATRYPDQLSGGQQQRVAIARALVNKPAVLLLDEPLAALDLNLRQQMQQVLRDLQRSSGTTFLFVTHDQTEAMTLSDRIGVMRDGELCQVGTAEDLYRRPSSRFVARFIGDANVLELDVRSGMAAVDGTAVRVAAGGDGSAISVRPENVRLVEAGDGAHVEPDAAGGLSGQITSATFLGAHVRYEVRTPAGVSLRVIRSASGRRHAVGSQVRAHWRPDDAVVLTA